MKYNMNWEALEDKLRYLVSQHYTARQIGKKLGCTPNCIRKKVRRLGLSLHPIIGVQEKSPDENNLRVDYGENKGQVELKSRRIKTLEDALTEANVDLSIWEVERHVINKWEVGIKNADGDGIITEPLWQIKIWLRRKIYNPVQIAIDEIARKFDKVNVVLPKVKQEKLTHPHLLVMGLFDVHMGLLAWREETGADWDLHIGRDFYTRAGINLLNKVNNYEIEQILIPIGNDFLHINSMENSTPRNNNPLDVDSRLAKIYETAFQSVIDLVAYCQQVAPVRLMFVPGNHDPETSYFLCHSLKSWFKNSKNIDVDVTLNPRKYFLYGKTLLGFTHGLDEPYRDLPAIMAAECRKMWSDSQYSEWLVGHFHKKKELYYIASDTYGGVVVRILSTLVANDAWHNLKGYVKSEFNRAAEAYLYSKNWGYAGNFVVNVAELENK